MSTNQALYIQNLSVNYGRLAVLQKVSLPPLRPGRIVALIGPNGAGKSTLLRALAGLLPARGQLRLGDIELTGLKPQERARYVGFMPQSMPADISLTVAEGLIGALRTDSRHAYTSELVLLERIDRLLTQLDIAALAPKPFASLSGGQRQMASLAQAVVREPPILLLDEPTSALDLRHQVDVMSMVKDIASAGRVVVVVLHDLTLAARWADEVVVLHAGRCHCSGPVAESITEAMLAQVYRVHARVELDVQGQLQIAIQGPTPGQT